MKYFSLQIKDQPLEALGSWVGSVDESEVDDASATPLVAAIQLGRIDVVRLMLDRNFSPTIKAPLTSPIGAAISSDSENAEQILNLLLQKNGRLTEEDPMDYCGELNEPMVHAAIRRRRVPIIRLLLQYGADPKWTDSDGLSALDLARELGDIAVIDCLGA